jgi:nucleotidyltransferase-like protein
VAAASAAMMGAAEGEALAASAADPPVAEALQAIGEGVSLADETAGTIPGIIMDELKELQAKFERAYNDRLVSVVLYGSAAAGDHHSKYSDLNVLCVLKEVTPRELSEGEPILRWWSDHGNPAPLLMSEEEVHNSADSFAIEFRDMKDHRKVLYGPDLIADLTIDTRFYRAQIEHELRSKYLRLRQQGARVLSDPAALLTLCVESVSTFCVLGRHALVVGGEHAKHERRAIVHQLGQALQMDVTPLNTLLNIREDKSGDPGDPGELFASYLECIRRMVVYVDRLEEKI